MSLTAIHPLPASGPSVAGTTDSVCSNSQSPVVYEYDSVGPLQTIDTTRTLAAKLCGKLNDAVFNARIVTLTQRVDAIIHVVGTVSVGTCLSLFFVANVPARNALSLLAAGTGFLFAIHGLASLSWDMLCRIARSFEFWFLVFINTTNCLLWLRLFADERTIALAASTLCFSISLCADANIYARRVVTRLLVVGSPALLLIVVMTAFRLPPDLNCTNFNVLDMDIDPVDLLVNGNLVIAYFTAIRVMRARHLVFSTGPIGRIDCDMYFPVCRLVPKTPGRLVPQPDQAPLQPIEQFEFIDQRSGHHIDSSDILAPTVASWLHRALPIKWFSYVAMSSYVAILASTLSWVIELPHDAAARTNLPLLVLGFTTSLVVVIVHALHYQRTLFQRVCREIDAWFVIFQATCVAVGSCDLMSWDPRRILLILTAWVWSIWIIFVDALPPITRRRLAFPHRLPLAVMVMLVVYPLLLGYWLYISPARATLHNRVLLDIRFHGMSMRADMLGFLASKLFMLWVWMGRFFWRELLRPADAFKLIKHRVFYRIAA